MIRFLLLMFFSTVFTLTNFIVILFAAQKDMIWVIPAPLLCVALGYYLRYEEGR